MEQTFIGEATGKPIVAMERSIIMTQDMIAAAYPGLMGEPTIHVLDHGFVTLVDCMPRLVPVGRTCDSAVVRAARVSYKGSLKTPEEDETLLRYLFRHKHMSPFEMCEFTFRMSLPILVARQMVRHRTASLNEVSGRYTELQDEFFMPEEWRAQSKTNKQGGEEPVDYTPRTYAAFPETGEYASSEEIAFDEYSRRISAGVSRELARTCLPVSTYTQWIWKCDLRNLLNFLTLRRDEHAQQEIRAYADAVYDLILPLVPHTLAAWRDYVQEAVTLSRAEVAAMRANFDNVRYELRSLTGQEYVFVANTPVHANKREQAEWLEKRRKLGLEVPFGQSTGI